MVASSDPRWLQWAFTTLVRLFDRVGLNTNVEKTVSMTCIPCTSAGNQSEEAYGRKMTGEGLTFLERKREQVECRDCGKEVAAGSLDQHRMSQHGKARERRWSWTDAATGGGGGEEPTTYRREFPKGGTKECPVEGRPGMAGTRTGDESAFLETARTGRRDHLGGGKTPSSKMPTMRHASPMAVTKWKPQEHSDVQEWGGEEETATGGGGGKGKH